MLSNNLFGGNALFSGQFCAFFQADLLSVQPGRFNALFRALVEVGDLFFGLFKGKPDLFFGKGQQIFVDTIKDKVNICPR